MGTDNQNNRSTALTPEALGQINTDLIAACRLAFEAGVAAGKLEIIQAAEARIAQDATQRGE